uniref:DNA2/NAM7 helicase-like C-terminal domain-containing protein n=1 Tax=Ditylenchus dipsaci TaxID=166011 RepID=A0A915EK78_9BILA
MENKSDSKKPGATMRPMDASGGENARKGELGATMRPMDAFGGENAKKGELGATMRPMDASGSVNFGNKSVTQDMEKVRKPRKTAHQNRCPNCKNAIFKEIHSADECPGNCFTHQKKGKLIPRRDCSCEKGKTKSKQQTNEHLSNFIIRYGQLSLKLASEVRKIEQNWSWADFPPDCRARLQKTTLYCQEFDYVVLDFNPHKFEGEKGIFGGKRCAFELCYLDSEKSSEFECLNIFGLINRIAYNRVEVHSVHHEFWHEFLLRLDGLSSRKISNICNSSAKMVMWRFPLSIKYLLPDFDQKLYARRNTSSPLREIDAVPERDLKKDVLNIAMELSERLKFNESQIRAVRMSVSENTIGVVQGPPGTGKTRVVSLVALSYYLAGAKVLCLAVMNRAVNHLLLCVIEMLEEISGDDAFSMIQTFRKCTVRIFADYLDSSYALVEDPAEDGDEQVCEVLQEVPEKLASYAQFERKFEPEDMQMVFTTLNKISSRRFKEAYELTQYWSMKLPILLFCTFLRHKSRKEVFTVNKWISTLILFGDQEQTMGMIYKELHEFEHELGVSAQALLWQNLPINFVFSSMSAIEGRVHCSTFSLIAFTIFQFPVTATASQQSQRSIHLSPPRARDGEESTLNDSRSIFNKEEAGAAVKLVKYYLAQNVEHENIVILSPYTAQVHCVKSELRKSAIRKINVFTIDDFQGQESDVVILT